NWPAWGKAWGSPSPQATTRRRMSGATISCARTVTLQFVACTLDILLHPHTLVVSGFGIIDAGLLLPGQQDAAAGVDNAAVALLHIQRDVGRLAALSAVAGDQEEGILVAGADLGRFLAGRTADDKADARIAVFAHIVGPKLGQRVADHRVDSAAVGEGLVLKINPAGVGGAAEDKDTLALFLAVR